MYRIVSQDYFAAMGIRVLSGRGFTAQDTVTSEPVIVVNQTFARRYLKGDPLGAQISADLVQYRRDASNMEGATSVVCLPLTSAEVQACVRIAVRHGVPFVPRGSGTGLAGGAVPLDGAVVIATSKMNNVISVDAVNRQAWVQPGVLNLDLTRQLEQVGLHFAPDPSSQQTCSIGGNVANNSGGPHCLAEGVTASHVIAVEVVVEDGRCTGELRDADLGGERKAEALRRWLGPQEPSARVHAYGNSGDDEELLRYAAATRRRPTPQASERADPATEPSTTTRPLPEGPSGPRSRNGLKKSTSS